MGSAIRTTLRSSFHFPNISRHRKGWQQTQVTYWLTVVEWKRPTVTSGGLRCTIVKKRVLVNGFELCSSHLPIVLWQCNRARQFSKISVQLDVCRKVTFSVGVVTQSVRSLFLHVHFHSQRMCSLHHIMSCAQIKAGPWFAEKYIILYLHPPFPFGFTLISWMVSVESNWQKSVAAMDTFRSTKKMNDWN